MSKIFAKLNLKDRNTLCVLNPPAAFRKELSLLRDARITDKLTEIGELEFVLAFVTQQAEVDKLSKTIAGKVKGGRNRLVRIPQGDVPEICLRFQPRHRLERHQEPRVRHGAAGGDRRRLDGAQVPAHRVHPGSRAKPLEQSSAAIAVGKAGLWCPPGFRHYLRSRASSSASRSGVPTSVQKPR